MMMDEETTTVQIEVVRGSYNEWLNGDVDSDQAVIATAEMALDSLAALKLALADATLAARTWDEWASTVTPLIRDIRQHPDYKESPDD